MQSTLSNQSAHIDQTGRTLIRIEGIGAGHMLGASNLEMGAGQESENGMLYRVRHDLFFWFGAIGADTAVPQTLQNRAAQQEGLITVTNVTNGHACLTVSGSEATAVLSCLCALDFDDSQFPNQTAKFSSVAKTRQLIIRQDVGDVPVYHLLGGRSFGAYLWQSILQASASFGIKAPGINVVNNGR